LDDGGRRRKVRRREEWYMDRGKGGGANEPEDE
jgi:hypothetical protein